MEIEFYLDFEKPLVEIEKEIKELKKANNKGGISQKLEALEKQYNELKVSIFSNLSPYQKVQLARHPYRPTSLDYINLIFTDFIELHGDRRFADDKSVVCGIADFDDEPVVIIGQQKGKTTEENIERNFGMPHPEGYRKAYRVMELAERFSKPLIIFIDTPGAYPGIGSEERGVAEAIAFNLMKMSSLNTQIICIVIGEGGSGGALGISVGDRILMLEHAFYSVISPEGCAAILFRDSSRMAEAAESLKLTAQDLYSFGIIDEIIKEPLGGAHRDVNETALNIKTAIKKHLGEIKAIDMKRLLEMRYAKFRRIHKYIEETEKKVSRKKREVKNEGV